MAARIERGFAVGQAAAVLMPLTGVHPGRDADAVAARTGADAHADAAAFTAVSARCGFAVLRGVQGNIPRRVKGQVFARLELTAGYRDIAALRGVILTGCRYRQVLPGVERAQSAAAVYRQLYRHAPPQNQKQRGTLHLQP